MNDPTQAGDAAPSPGPPGGPGDPAPGPVASAPGAAGGFALTPVTPDGPTGGDPFFDGAAIQRGLWLWLAIIGGGTIFCALLGHFEGGLFFAGAGAFVLAQATDAASVLERYRSFVHGQLPAGTVHGALVRALVRSLVPLAGALGYTGLAAWAWSLDAGRDSVLACAWSAAAALVCLAFASRRVSDGVSRRLFGGGPGRTRRLTARLVVMALLLPVPVRLIWPSLLGMLREQGTTSLADPAGLVAQLAGELAIAVAGVGLFVRRDWTGTLRRLGLTGVKPVHLLVVVAGVAAAILMNVVIEGMEKRWFLPLWQQDSEITGMIAGSLPAWGAIVLGVSAGVGEEVTVRGALQPRLGIVLSAILFASGHVQYSWYGMATVGLLGALLGVIRARTNTTTAILVHALYDIFAVLTN